MTDHTAKARELFDAWGWALPQIDELAAALREAAAVEREACARTLWETVRAPVDGSHALIEKCMAAIRSRGEVAK